MPPNLHAPRQLLQCCRRWNEFDLRPVFAFVRVARMKQALIQASLITQQQQTFRIRIEPANRIDVLRKTKFRERAMRGAVRRELRENAMRFVESY